MFIVVGQRQYQIGDWFGQSIAVSRIISTKHFGNPGQFSSFLCGICAVGTRAKNGDLAHLFGSCQRF
jgi:hypothetical protein